MCECVCVRFGVLGALSVEQQQEGVVVAAASAAAAAAVAPFAAVTTSLLSLSLCISKLPYIRVPS